MIFKSKIKWAALLGLVFSLFSLLVHLLLANYSTAELVQYNAMVGLAEDFTPKFGRESIRYRKLWGAVKPLESLQPYANPRSRYPVPNDQNNGFIYAKIFGRFEKIRSSICDLVTISRLLNATLVIPEIQDSTRSKGISSKFKSFSYLYNEEQFIAALTNDVIIVKSLPDSLKEARKRKEFPLFKPKSSASPSFYIKEVLPELKRRMVIGLVLNDGGCLQSILPPSLAEYQRLRCRVAFHALHFRPEIQALGHQIVERLRVWGQPYLAFHPGIVRDTLAYHGCAELFQDVHTELIQHRRKQMMKEGIINEKLSVDSHVRKINGSCPLMPEEVGLLLRAMGYPPNTIIYVAGSEVFGGQRVLIPLRAMYVNLVDQTSLCSKQELSDLIGPETPLPQDTFHFPQAKSEKQLIEEWKKAGPRPRPLPPPPDRPIYRHEKEGWYGWIAESDKEPDPSPMDFRMQAHRLLWDALDYIVSVEADAFFPGFNNDGSGGPDFAGLVMGHRLYEMASARTYRPDRKVLSQLFNSTSDHMYYPKLNWTISVREHLNKSLGEDGLVRESNLSKQISFLSHPLPECSCRTPGFADIPNPVRGIDGQLLYGGEDECPKWMEHGLATVSLKAGSAQESKVDEKDSTEDDTDLDELPESDDNVSRMDSTPPSEQDEEMDPDD
ncbi:protein EMBRYO SAC DEVELOPMENT ARREST 30 [Macadamia integrifolia]|uniref:protein EMBRYO SAC DEVELOPMENT ARREST 30 n=1 Tax=Macadamia integrifolia TaxID=60698 RepID=UPI001C4E92B0|nr:protein EMBRYO SAC DEVELOPMENT ARREST 30 [Macadamia integrifolia]